MTDDLDVILEKHANLFENTRVPSSIKEAFELLMKNDYINEVTQVEACLKKNKNISCFLNTPYGRYPEFKDYNYLLNNHPYLKNYISYIYDVVADINNEVKRYNQSKAEDRENLRADISIKTKHLQLIINTI